MWPVLPRHCTYRLSTHVVLSSSTLLVAYIATAVCQTESCKKLLDEHDMAAWRLVLQDLSCKHSRSYC